MDQLKEERGEEGGRERERERERERRGGRTRQGRMKRTQRSVCRSPLLGSCGCAKQHKAGELRGEGEPTCTESSPPPSRNSPHRASATCSQTSVTCMRHAAARPRPAPARPAVRETHRGGLRYPRSEAVAAAQRRSSIDIKTNGLFGRPRPRGPRAAGGCFLGPRAGPAVARSSTQ